jgi:Zn-dependent protease with chaperone function
MPPGKIAKFNCIDPKSWEHPADKAALSILNQVKGFDELVKLLMSVTTERSLKLMALSSSVKVSKTQYPMLNKILNDVVNTFDWDYTPPVFVTQSPFWNAETIGVDEPFIMINSSMLQLLNEKEMTALVAHEMGHIMSGHALYKTLLWMLTRISISIIPMADLLVVPIRMALCEWDRKSELTADRAEMLAVQEPQVSYNLLMKLSGAEDLSQVNLNDFFAQAEEYENQKTILDGIHKFLNQLWATHPFPVIRLRELKTWEMSGSYESILNGNYLRKDWKAKNDTISNITKDVAGGLGKAAGEIGKATRDLSDSLKDMFQIND